MARKPDTVPDTPTESEAPPSFESSLAELEGIVAAMEAGQMPLQESLDAYQRGMALLAQCRATLDVAERQIRILENGKLQDVDTHAAGSDAAPEKD